MKKIVTILFLLICVGAVSQHNLKGTHVILIRNLNNARFLRIPVNNYVYVETTSGRVVLDKISLIKADTLFFPDTFVTAPDILRLQYPLSHIRPRKTHFDHAKTTYVKGEHYEIICPPDSVFNKYWGFTRYYIDLYGKAKKQWLATLDPLVYKNFLKWNLSKLLHLELGFSYERLISRNFSWETEISGMLGVPGATYFSFSPLSYPYYNNDGISVTTCPKFYFKPRTYLSVAAMYRYLTAKQIRSDWPFGQDHGNLQDQFSNDFGLSIRIGFMRRHNRTVFDNYVGIGIKYIKLHRLDYGSFMYSDSNAMYWYHKDHSPDKHDDYLFWPVFNLGIKIGRAFGR